MYEQMVADEGIRVVPICREGESMAVAAGLWVGGKKPVVMIQNTGLFESGDSVRGLSLDIGFPLVMIVGYRGWTRHGVTRDSAARHTEPILHAWGLNYYLVETDADAERISTAFEEAQRTQRPVVCLIGAEYG
jgi:sulfopyruvate decarboxylase TPP-binding subunit